MLSLPFPEGYFDKVVSVTAIEFIDDAECCIKELFRVTREGGYILVATLNSLSPWASERRAVAERENSIFERAVFRSPDEMRSFSQPDGVIKTAIHFQKGDDLAAAEEIERRSSLKGLNTGAFLAALWEKPSGGGHEGSEIPTL